MLSGGEALEAYAVRSASSVLEALAKRMPSRVHRHGDGSIAEVSLEEVAIGDVLVVFPHEILLVSGDRESEVRYLAEQVGIREVYAGQSPEQKLELVRAETNRANTVMMGDGINDAPALTAATVGIAFGQNSDITAEAAGAVILESSLEKADEFLHISRRLRTIALQSAVGGMAASVVGMLLAAFGYLPPVAGAIAQEIIDVAAVVNALRVAIRPQNLSDYR